VQAQGKNDVLDALGRLAAEMRGKLGESLGSVQKYDIPLEQVTTPSLEALQSYTLGGNTQSQTGDFAASLPFFHKAIEIDPNFAMAYWALGDAYSTIGETASSAEYMRKAFALRARVSEREKSVIEGDYYFYATGDLVKARRSFELHAKMYPDSDYSQNMLAGCSMMIGQYDAALSEAQEALRLAPFQPFLYRLVALNYLLSERVEDAVATAKEAHAKGLDSDLGAVLYGIAFYRNDAAEMARQGASAMGKPGEEDLLLAMEADTAAYFGHVGKARNFSQRAVVSAERAGGGKRNCRGLLRHICPTGSIGRR
jgi:tetratricopeptide (TPR) repeat protein